MKKLFWSAFAMSLVLLTSSSFAQTEAIDDFLGLETEVLPDLKGKQRFSPLDMHQTKDWNVSPRQVERDSKPLKNQKHSLIAWDRVDPESWMDIQLWLRERGIKDKIPDWKLRLRDDRQFEHMGKILKCRGSCEVYRGTMKASVQHLSRLDEGDELRTGEDSAAWIFLIDGTLMRVGPKSSVSLQEINWSPDEVFYLVRLNQGHVYWHPREKQDYPLELSPETDAFSLPLMVREANQQFFERDIFQKQTDVQRSLETTMLEETAIAQQIARINELRKSTATIAIPKTKVMLVASNVTTLSTLTSFDLFHYPGGKSFFKARKSGDFSINLRGYSDITTHKIEDLNWHEVEPSGRSFEKVSQVSGQLEITELITRRIKSLELAREIWLQHYTLPIVANLGTPLELATKHGYFVWGSDIQQRFNFLLEYTRRMETTNLKSMENLLAKLEANGEFNQKEMDDGHYQAALNSYLLQLKKRYINKRMQVREMNDLQYYVWILRNGKNKN